MAHIARSKLLTREEKMILSRLARAGDEKALARLVEKNSRLLVSVVKKHRGMGLPFEDAVTGSPTAVLRTDETTVGTKPNLATKKG